MHFFYDDGPRGKFDPAAMAKINPTRQHCKHYSQLLELDFIAQHPKTTFIEKAQARKEMERATKTMKYWSERHGFDSAAAQTEKNKMNRVWQDRMLELKQESA